ncbi:MAG: choice-of-anchor D domain-containing protein [Xanthomonadales bacterium]|nr:choice-of-anchor D domain-containing protein [Xanthomonadales bacterium]
MFHKMNVLAMTKGLVAGAFLVSSASLFAQQSEIEIGTGSGQPGDSVSVPVTLNANNHDVTSTNFDIAFDDTSLTLGTTGVSCGAVQPGAAVQANGHGLNCSEPSAGTLRVLITAPIASPVPPLPTGELFTILMDIDGAVTPPDTFPLTVSNESMGDTAGGDVDPADYNFVDGSVEALAGPQSELALTPDPLAFGTVDLGNMPQTDTFTLENTGAADAEVTSVTLAGPDGEFTIAADNCTGTLAAGASCTIDIEFNAAANGTYSNQIDIASDANVNPNPSADITGSADSVANLSVNPAFGPVDLGTVVVGSSNTANGSVSNNGSADGEFSCTLGGDPEITTNPDLSGPINVPAGGSVDFSLTCAVPDTAAEGDTFSATLSCSSEDDPEFSGTHDISCGATEFVQYPVPTMSKVGMGILALLMVMVGGLSVRFFRT